jgi:predicted nucleic acid-binding Zn ribbon protein
MRRSNTQKLSDVLKDYVQENKLGTKLSEVDLIASWEKVVGKTISKYTESLRIVNGTLFIKTSSAALRSELIMMKEQLRSRLNEQAGSEIIRDIVFR